MQRQLPPIIADLVARFDQNIESYRNAGYNETQLRREFLDPFFEALEWDVSNRGGLAEAYKDVIHEDAVKIGGETKAPDYCFRVGGKRIFFVEAKKPATNVKNDPGPAYQVRRYAWSAKLSLSVLTDFEEFAVYDCRTRPRPNDKPSTGRILYMKYSEYASRWDEIASIFSKDAVLKGSFDKFAISERRRGTATVDAAFLAEIEGWRDALARNLALRNPSLSVHELNFAVQRTIDRIIFLRICEDRGVETYGELRTLLNGENVYQRLRHLYRIADERYNSGLFHFQPEKGRAEAPDELTPTLQIDDKILKDIIHDLYYPESPYEFSVMPAEILGQVYEQFLGKVIRLTSGHQAKVEEKPEVKKAGGVYYTPAYIVEYIVRNTVGKLCDGKTPKQIAKLKILDPACGSGSFLIGAYDYLMTYYRDWYLKDGPEKHAKELYQGAGGQWHLTTQEKKRILLNNIHGVDIDAQAVEVTKLSLSLKVLEGENQDTLLKQLKMWHERALPDLGHNIKCGNSLIGPDYFAPRQTSLFDEETTRRVNPFDWETEFRDIMQTSGFSVVIGNPPWGAEFDRQEKDYLRTRYQAVHVRTPESFNYFVKRMWDCTRSHGTVGVILPSSFLNQHEFWKTRKLLVETASIRRVCNLGDGVFENVTAPCAVIVFSEKDNSDHAIYLDLRKTERANLSADLLRETGGIDASQIGLDSDGFLLQVRSGQKIFQTCYRWPPLKDIAEDVATGISSGLDAAYVYNVDDARRLKLETKLLRKLVVGGEIHRYSLTPQSGKKIIYITPETKTHDCPHVYSALATYRDRLKKRREAANGKIPWYSLNWPRRQKLFDEPKILIRQTSDRILASYDSDQWYCLKSAIIVQLKQGSSAQYLYLLALLNSRLMHFLYNDLVGEQSRVFPEVKPVQLFKLPIRIINFSLSAERVNHDKMVTLVERMLDLYKRLVVAKTPDDKTKLQRQIDATDHEIDRLVYSLYELTPDEIALVEGTSVAPKAKPRENTTDETEAHPTD